jgi:hypothetical protein
MQPEIFNELYSNLSIAGLTGDLHERMQTIRPGISRNTIRLAFLKPNIKSKLRPRIIVEARKLWEEHLEETAA